MGFDEEREAMEEREGEEGSSSLFLRDISR